MKTTIFRPEIQGLRAVAVVMVVLYHIWPNLFPGGYVGVDVFFVISGYLITGLLIREFESNGQIKLKDFYSRRIRRLLPAATFVLLAVGFSIPLLPDARWGEVATEIGASALYIQNWLLAWLSVDYLGSENVLSPVQHYWSLSIEEQFYMFWPIIIIGCGVLAKKTRKSFRSILFISLSAIVTASFIASIIYTIKEPEAAYFLTQTRVWELGLGGLLALLPISSPSKHIAESLRILGLGLIIVACFMFSSATAFPGYMALIPTIGTILLVVAHQKSPKWGTYSLLSSQLFSYLGNISYSLYLWHWPIISFYSSFYGSNISALPGVCIFITSILLAHLTKIYVEDPFRSGRFRIMSISRSFTLGLSSIASCLLLTAGIHGGIKIQTRHIDLPLTDYPGPAAILEGVSVPDVSEFLPSSLTLKQDLPEVYRQGCHVRPNDFELSPCDYGNQDSDFRVVIVGDSHAAHWIPALRVIAEERNWRLTTHTKSGCPLNRFMLNLRGRPYRECQDWGKNVLKSFETDPPNLIVFSQSTGKKIFDDGSGQVLPSRAEALLDIWNHLSEMGIPIIAIPDTPRLEFEPFECFAFPEKCAVKRSKALREDPIQEAQQLAPNVGLADMTNAFCSDTECPVLIGNMVVFRDKHHITKTYSAALAPYLGIKIDEFLNIRKPAER
jgi:peptidoglycan/LPS O-acetylase OafA/YrhL